MQINLCDVCKVSGEVPEGCIICAYMSERNRRVMLERQMLDLLGLMRGGLNKTEAVVRGNAIDVPLLPSGSE